MYTVVHAHYSPYEVPMSTSRRKKEGEEKEMEKGQEMKRNGTVGFVRPSVRSFVRSSCPVASTARNTKRFSVGGDDGAAGREVVGGRIGSSAGVLAGGTGGAMYFSSSVPGHNTEKEIEKFIKRFAVHNVW